MNPPATNRSELLRMVDQSAWANRVRVAGAQRTRDTFVVLEKDNLPRQLEANQTAPACRVRARTLSTG